MQAQSNTYDMSESLRIAFWWGAGSSPSDWGVARIQSTALDNRPDRCFPTAALRLWTTRGGASTREEFGVALFVAVPENPDQGVGKFGTEGNGIAQ